MTRVALNGTELAYQERGSGPAVICLHCGFLADASRPLFENPVLGSQHRLVPFQSDGNGVAVDATGRPVVTGFSSSPTTRSSIRSI